MDNACYINICKTLCTSLKEDFDFTFTFYKIKFRAIYFHLHAVVFNIYQFIICSPTKKIFSKHQ